jgi:hypothetical protein
MGSDVKASSNVVKCGGVGKESQTSKHQKANVIVGVHFHSIMFFNQNLHFLLMKSGPSVAHTTPVQKNQDPDG